MGFKPVIRQNDVDSGGDRQQNTQSNFLVDEGGNLQLKGSIDGSGAGAGGGITFSNAEFTGVVRVHGSGSVILQKGTINANDSGALFKVNFGGDRKVYINSPQGSAVNCLKALAQADADADGSSVDMSNGYPTDSGGETLGTNRANADDMGGGMGGGYSDCIPTGDYPSNVNPIDATGTSPQPNTIIDTAIPVNSENGEINRQLQLGPGDVDNPSPPTVSWRMNGAPEGVTIDEHTGKISGNMPMGDFKTTVTATDATTGVDLDTKTYNLRRVEPSRNTGTQLQSPIQKGKYRISSGYGPRKPPRTAGGGRGSKNHGGIDMAAPTGTPVGSAGSGKVIFAGRQGGYGNLVKVAHYNENGKQVAETLYGHLSSINVREGQTLNQGELLGKVGSTGNSSGPHLHFETKKMNSSGRLQRMNPLAAMNGSHPNEIGGGMANNQGIYLDSGGSCGSSVPSGNCGEGFGDPTADISDGRDNGSATGGNTAINTIPPDVARATDGDGGGSTSGIEPPGADEKFISPQISINDKANVYLTISEPEDEKFISRSEVIEIMNDVFDRHLELDNQDIAYLFFIARIESGFDPWDQDPISSRKGLFKMCDAVAFAYPHDRNDVESSTEAMIQFYLKEEKRYWDHFVESKGTKLSQHLVIEPRAAEKYKTYSKLEFIYGLIHHDGVIAAVQGISQGGVAYAQRMMKSFSRVLH